MNKKYLKFEIINTLFIITLGVILHFAYDWSNNNLFIGFISSINESTWEHLKILFIPMVITAIVGQVYIKNNYLTIKTKAILLSLATIVIIFYTYTGILGTSIGWINIAIFILAAIIGEIYTYKRLHLLKGSKNTIFLSVLLFLMLAFGIFTLKPPKIGIFKDPVTNTYGIYQQTK